MNFDVSKLIDNQNNEFEKQLKRIQDSTGYTESIVETVDAASKSLSNGCRSFVIYGEPQSGKTEMMICLTAKLLDNGFKNIVILVNDSIDLQAQNLLRFKRSRLSPTPKGLSDIKNLDALDDGTSNIIFCKKNQSDLKTLIKQMRKIGHRVVIDDEADYATPNSKVNKSEQSKINELIDNLLSTDDQSIYIGVTATPARLHLNNTFDNVAMSWVYFRPYPGYSGREVFFPRENVETLDFNLIKLPEEGDNPGFLNDAIVRFMVNVAHLNLTRNKSEMCYSMLIHTSGIKGDHHNERVQIEKFFKEIQDVKSEKFAKRFNQIYLDAKSRYSIDPELIVNYVFNARRQYSIKVINSDADKSTENLKGATDPESLFTFVVGGNIISRGVTFDNLLTLFFARTAKYMQQDTYVQRARMFGNRTGYLDHFELHIPKSLYVDWHRAFTLLGLSMASIMTGNPVWMEDRRIRAAAKSSIEKATLYIDKGEISFSKFALNQEILQQTENSLTGFSNFKKLLSLLPPDYLTNHILDFVNSVHANDDEKIVVHSTRIMKDLGKSTDIDYADISRPKGLYGGQDFEEAKYPKAVHHFKIFANENNEARLIYSYKAKEAISFLRVTRNRS